MKNGRVVKGLGYIDLRANDHHYVRRLGAYACTIREDYYGEIIGSGYSNDPEKAVEIATTMAKDYYARSAVATAALDKILENIT